MAFWSLVLGVLIFVWGLFKDWLFIFISPIKNLDILWIIVPIWVSWFFAEFFQEKKGTSFGNAISNGVIPIFVGVDWIRYLTNLLISHTMKYSYTIILKYLLSALIIVYGLSIIWYGVKAKVFIHFYGRIRVVTYLLLIFSPIVYNIIELKWEFLLGVAVFFPLYYFLIEWIDRIVPNPKIYEYDKGQQLDMQPEDEFSDLTGFRALTSNDYKQKRQANFQKPNKFNKGRR